MLFCYPYILLQFFSLLSFCMLELKFTVYYKQCKSVLMQSMHNQSPRHTDRVSNSAIFSNDVSLLSDSLNFNYMCTQMKKMVSLPKPSFLSGWFTSILCDSEVVKKRWGCALFGVKCCCLNQFWPFGDFLVQCMLFCATKSHGCENAQG